MENTIVVATKGIIVYDNKVLILKRAENDEIGANTWEFVGGKIEFGEGLEDSLTREINEEAGLSVAINKLLYAITFQTGENRQVIIISYLCKANDNIVTLSSEHQDYLWADKEQMLSLLSSHIIDDLNRNNVWDCIFK